MTTTKMQHQRVYLVDRHRMFLDGFERLLRSEPDIEVIGRDSHSDSAYAQIQTLLPDLVLTDTELPGRGAMTMAAALRRRCPLVNIAFLTTHISLVCLNEAIRLGARGFFLKSDDANEIISLLRRIGKGETCYSADIQRLLTTKGDTKTDRVDSIHCLSEMTDRQLDILRQLARGRTVKEVAQSMDISARSVESHKYRIMQKLEIHDRVELAMFAVREGLIVP